MRSLAPAEKSSQKQAPAASTSVGRKTLLRDSKELRIPYQRVIALADSIHCERYFLENVQKLTQLTSRLLKTASKITSIHLNWYPGKLHHILP